MAAARRQAARQCRPLQFQAGGPGGARPHGACVRTRPDQAERLRIAGAALERGGLRSALALGKMEDAPRQAVPGAWRFAGRLPAAAGIAALCAAGAISLYRAGRSVGAARRAAGPRANPCRAGRGRGSRFAARPGRGLLHRRIGAAGPRRAGAWRDRRRGSHGDLGRTARRQAVHLHAAGRGVGGLSRAGRRSREGGQEDRPARPYRGLRAAARSAPQRHPRRAGPGRHRGQHPSGRELGGLRRHHDGDLRGGAAVAAWRRQVHDRRPPHRHRRRQPCGGRRRDAQRQPVPAPARSVEEPGAALAAPPVAVLSVLRPVHRPDQPGAALRRGPPRQPLRAGDRDGAGAAPRHGRRTAAVAGRPAVPQPSGRRHRQHPSLGDLHRQAVLAGRPDRHGSASSSSAASRCRPTPA